MERVGDRRLVSSRQIRLKSRRKKPMQKKIQTVERTENRKRKFPGKYRQMKRRQAKRRPGGRFWICKAGWRMKNSWPVLSHIWDIGMKMICPLFRTGYKKIIPPCLRICPFWLKFRKNALLEPVMAICFVSCPEMKIPLWQLTM